jgi:putative membrane protein
MIPAGLLGGYLLFWGAMGLHPLDRENWLIASILPLTFVAALSLGRRALPLSTGSYVLIAAFLGLHTIGAHYTYARVPTGTWLQAALSLDRNHFDRIVHFAFGLLLTYPLFDAFGHLTGASRALRYYVVLMTQLGLAGCWEIIEAAVAQVIRPDLGPAFLGSQGDVWDAQHDMLAAACGTLIALLALASWARVAAVLDRPLGSLVAAVTTARAIGRRTGDSRPIG